MRMLESIAVTENIQPQTLYGTENIGQEYIKMYRTARWCEVVDQKILTQNRT